MLKDISNAAISAIIAGVTMFIGVQAEEAKAQSRALWLQDGEVTTVSGYFYAGESIYGECDQDCFDLDLFLYDANGALVAEDSLPDYFPVVTAPYEGYYTVDVYVYDCSHRSGCAVALESDYGF